VAAQLECGHLVGQAAGMGLEQRPLLAGRLVAPASASQVGAHVFDAQPDGTQVAQGLQVRDVLGTVAPVPA
jgi:hypothetical protein